MGNCTETSWEHRMRFWIWTVASLCLLATSVVAGDAGFGDTVTDDIELSGDISGSGDGLTIGASGITIDLKGHTISSTDGTGVGINNPDGYDDITIKNFWGLSASRPRPPSKGSAPTTNGSTSDCTPKWPARWTPVRSPARLVPPRFPSCSPTRPSPS